MKLKLAHVDCFESTYLMIRTVKVKTIELHYKYLIVVLIQMLNSTR